MVHTLDIVISTIGHEGILRIGSMNLPELYNINYIIGWQLYDKTLDLPTSLIRNDIKIIYIDGKGISNNRNITIASSNADLIYIADDDISIDFDSIPKIIECFGSFPDTDIATFQSISKSGPIYPDKSVLLRTKLPKGYYIRSIDIAAKKEIFMQNPFDTRFGLNSGQFEGCEEELWHLNLRKKGYVCRFFPLTIASHIHESSGTGKEINKKHLQAMGIIIRKSYPLSFVFRLPLKAFRLTKSQKLRFLETLFHLSVGILKSYHL